MVFCSARCSAEACIVRVARCFGSHGTKHWRKVVQFWFLICSSIVASDSKLQKVASKAPKPNFEPPTSAKSSPIGAFSPNLVTAGNRTADLTNCKLWIQNIIFYTVSLSQKYGTPSSCQLFDWYLQFFSGTIHRHCDKIRLMICLRTIATQKLRYPKMACL